MGAAEVAFEVLLGIAALLMTDYDATVFANGGEASGHRSVVAEKTVAVQFGESLEGELHVIEREGTGRMARDLNPLPRGEIGINFLPRLLEFLLHAEHLGFQIDIIRGGTTA